MKPASCTWRKERREKSVLRVVLISECRKTEKKEVEESLSLSTKRHICRVSQTTEERDRRNCLISCSSLLDVEAQINECCLLDTPQTNDMETKKNKTGLRSRSI